MKFSWQRGVMFAGVLAAACSEVPDQAASAPSWEQFKRAATREFNGETFYVADGDLRVTLDELRQDYDQRLAALLEGDTGIAQTEQSSTVNQVGGIDDLWPVGSRRDLTYCVSDSFGADKARAISEMAQATRDWERYGNFHFRYVPAQDASCTNANTSIVFSVQPWSGSGACAFFPSGGGCVERTLVMNFSAFATGAVTSQGVFRHELGHTLGLRHEHIRAPGTFCTEDSSWRAVTAYDSGSVMHYPWCTGATNTGDLVITPLDQAGIRSLYGPSSAHGFAWVTDTGIVSPDYSYNSAGGTITATVGATGFYTVSFGGLGGIGGDVQVVAYGQTSARCKVSSWGGSWPSTLSIGVACHTPGGTPQASAFVVQYARKDVTVDGAGAYLWAEQPSSAAYCPTNLYSWNSTGGVNCISRPATGTYDVTLPGLTATGGTFQITAYGSAGEHCKIQSWGPSGGGQFARVLCFGPTGVAVDTRFDLNYFAPQEVSVFDYGAYAWAHNPTASVYTPSTTYSYNSGYINGWPGCVGWLGAIEGGKASVDPGSYYLWYENLSATGSAVHSTAYGTGSAYCKVQNWFSPARGGTQAQTQCYAADGTKVNTTYVGTYATRLFRGPC
jgi:hypothetical protein